MSKIVKPLVTFSKTIKLNRLGKTITTWNFLNNNLTMQLGLPEQFSHIYQVKKSKKFTNLFLDSGESFRDPDSNQIRANIFLNEQNIRRDSNPKIRDSTQHYLSQKAEKQ
jgi:hypothetical protein